MTQPEDLVAEKESKPKNTKAEKPAKKQPPLWKRLTRRTNLNHTTMAKLDLENLRIRVSMADHTRDKAKREELIAIVCNESLEDYKRTLLKKYNLRPGKRYNFDLRTGDIDNEKSPAPKELTPDQSDTKDAPAAPASDDNPTEPPVPTEPEPSTQNGSSSKGEAA